MRTLRIQGWWFTLDWAAAEHVPLREILSRSEYWPLASFIPKAGQLIVDVGANAGVYSVAAGTMIGPSGRLVSIEPNPIVVARLRSNLHRNGLGARSEVVDRGLSDSVGHGRLIVGSNSTTGTTNVDRGSDEGTTVQLDTLDAIGQRLGLGDVDLLKVDVEGSEIPVLDGAVLTLAGTRRAVVEVSHAADVEGVIARCRAAGLTGITTRVAGIDSGAALVFAARPGA